jgi:hypothetical protein
VENPVEEDAEEIVLSRWDKTKQWIEIAVATKKIAMILWTLIFGVTGTAVVGQVTGTKPFKDAAISLGIVEAQPIDTTTGMLQEELMIQLATIQQEINELKARELVSGVNGKDGKNGVDGKDGANGKDGRDGKDGLNGRDGQDGNVATTVNQMFDNHVDLLH